MKKIFISVLSAMLILSVVYSNAQAADTSTSTTEKPNFEKYGPPPPPRDGNFSDANRPPAPPNGDFKGGQRPNKKPDGKPGGDRVPPEFSSTSSTNSN